MSVESILRFSHIIRIWTKCVNIMSILNNMYFKCTRPIWSPTWWLKASKVYYKIEKYFLIDATCKGNDNYSKVDGKMNTILYCFSGIAFETKPGYCLHRYVDQSKL